MSKQEHDKMFGSQVVFTFVQPTEKLKITYREQQARLKRAVAKHQFLQNGCLLDTLEKGVSFPVIHVNFRPRIQSPKKSNYNENSRNNMPKSSHNEDQDDNDLTKKGQNKPFSVASTVGLENPARTITRSKIVAPLASHEEDEDVDEAIEMTMTMKESESESLQKQKQEVEVLTSKKNSSSRNSRKSKGPQLSTVRLLKPEALGPSFHVQQGLYEEVKRIEPDYKFTERDNIDSRAFIFLGFKTLDTEFSSVLEHTWRDWTGARSIYLKLHDDFDLSKIIFYHRISPISNLDMFMYIVLVECWNVQSSNLIRILDFVQRMRVERLNGYISLYRDLGLEEDETDSNYHSGSQESLPISLNNGSTSLTAVHPVRNENQGYQSDSADSFHQFHNFQKMKPLLRHEDESIYRKEEEEEEQIEIKIVTKKEEEEEEERIVIVETHKNMEEDKENNSETRYVEQIALETPKRVKFPPIN